MKYGNDFHSAQQIDSSGLAGMFPQDKLALFFLTGKPSLYSYFTDPWREGS
jgi:hypothetical protein